MNKRLLITGSFGLVGTNICKILERDYPDIEITKVKYDEHKMVTDRETYDYVIYAAGYGQPLKFLQDKLKTLSIHCGFSLTMALKGLKKDGTFLYISSSEVYSGAPSPHTEDMIGTTTPQHPRACYIEGKRCGEAICMAYKEQGYNVKIARLALAYGPGTKKGDTRVINQFIEQALTTGKIVMKDKGEAKRAYIYIEDAAKYMLAILFNGKDCVYNVGRSTTLSILELAQRISGITGAEYMTGKESLQGAPDEVNTDMSKAMAEFEIPFTDFDTGLKRTIEYQKQLYA